MAGSFAIIKVFVPKTFKPLSMELSKVLIAVITLITENIPTDIPNSVKIDRSLFSLIASMVIRILSLNKLLI